MEALNNVANAAARAVWGTNDKETKEPVSGVAGDTSKGEPYDAGNLATPAQEKIATGFHDNHDTKTDTTKAPADTPADAKTDTTKAAAAPAAPAAPKAAPSAAPKDNTSGQNDVRSPSDPATDHEPEKHDVTTEGIEADLKAPGPKPVAEVAKAHGGDAGKSDSQKNLNKDDDAASVSSASSSSSEEEGAIQKHSHGTGTGEQYVKSSGMNADGGDFDASAPGAGREADRLLEQKGITRDIARADTDHKLFEKDSPKSGKTKTSLKDKIKEKLHRS